jgi:hypothetical protein
VLKHTVRASLTISHLHTIIETKDSVDEYIKIRFLIVREEHTLRVFENRELRIFGHKREEVAGGWRRLHSEILFG